MIVWGYFKKPMENGIKMCLFSAKKMYKLMHMRYLQNVQGKWLVWKNYAWILIFSHHNKMIFQFHFSRNALSISFYHSTTRLLSPLASSAFLLSLLFLFFFSLPLASSLSDTSWKLMRGQALFKALKAASESPWSTGVSVSSGSLQVMVTPRPDGNSRVLTFTY